MHCDNAGENMKLEEKYDADGLGIIFEYTATGTPQQNAYVKRAFPTRSKMGRAVNLNESPIENNLNKIIKIVFHVSFDVLLGFS